MVRAPTWLHQLFLCEGAALISNVELAGLLSTLSTDSGLEQVFPRVGFNT
jgi:hypothetical protein